MADRAPETRSEIPSRSEILTAVADRGLSPLPYGSTAESLRDELIKLCNLQRRILPQTPPGVPGPGPVHADIGMKIDINVGGVGQVG